MFFPQSKKTSFTAVKTVSYFLIFSLSIYSTKLWCITDIFSSPLQVSSLFFLATRRVAWVTHCIYEHVFYVHPFWSLGENNGIAQCIKCSKWTEINSTSPVLFPPLVRFVWSLKIYYVIASWQTQVTLSIRQMRLRFSGIMVRVLAMFLFLYLCVTCAK
jgi:hypothetical protein